MEIRMKKSATRVTIVIIILVMAMVGYYAYLTGKSRSKQQEAALSRVQSTLSRSLEHDYPATPKQVLVYYNELMKCFYNESCTEEEIEALGNKARELYDQELLDNNSEGPYMDALKMEILDYRNNKRMITKMSVSASNNVDYFEENGFSFARIMCTYNIMENGVNYCVDEIYLLRQDENKRWKIYGWDAAENVKLEENGTKE